MVRTSERGFKQGMSLVRKRDDLIAGKGNGLIMLLHGGPGTGKTLTAGKSPVRNRSSRLTEYRKVRVVFRPFGDSRLA